MARKRSLDPNIWSDPKVLKLRTGLTKCIWIGLISHADDEGIIEADIDSLKQRLGLMESLAEIEEALQKIETQEMAVKYQINGQSYYFLPNWFRHQQIQYPSPSLLQRPTNEILANFPEYSMNIQRMLIEYSLLREVKLREVKLSKVKYKYISVEQIEQDVEQYEKLQKTYPNLNLKQEFQKMERWIEANPGKGKKLNWLRFVVNWLNNAGGYHGNSQGSSGEDKSKESKYGHLSRKI